MTALTYDDAAHLLRRMGFGGDANDINNLASMGREGAVSYLVNYQSIDDSGLENVLSQNFDLSNPNDITNFNDNELKRWWMTRMVLTKRQFQEKMTLFWHNHFATALSKVPRQYMYVQNLLLRGHALDQFDNLLTLVSQDPAMLIWLDGITNKAATPNENFARELQELFTMGQSDVVTGVQNYTQQDVTQIARAFTGWQFSHTPGGGPFDYSFSVSSPSHDNGIKTIYGQQADFGGQDVITVIAARPATPRFLTKKLFEFFVYPLDITNSADTATIDKFANVYLSNNHSIQALVTAIFTSDEFFSDRARFGLIKNPVEMIAGAIRMSGADYNPGSGSRRDGSLYTSCKNMGMDLMDPPDVSGWHLNAGWINTSSMLERFNFANTLTTNRFTSPTTQGPSISANQVQNFVAGNAKKTVRGVFQALGPLTITGAAFKAMKIYLMTDDTGSVVGFQTDPTTIDKKIRGLLHQVLATPEFQLN